MIQIIYKTSPILMLHHPYPTNLKDKLGHSIQTNQNNIKPML